MHGCIPAQRIGHAHSERIYVGFFSHPRPHLLFYLAGLQLHLYQADYLIYLEQGNHERDQRIFQVAGDHISCYLVC